MIRKIFAGELLMINAAIVDDEQSAGDLLEGYLKRYSEECGTGIGFNVSRFNDGLSFLASAKSSYDIVYMDIDMPDFDGMKTAEKLRSFDSSVVIVFVTNMMQFAVKGYEVGALDFLVKPVSYDNFALKLRRAIEQIKVSGADRIILVSDGVTRAVRRRDIKYAEIISHDIVYHTSEGDIRTYGSLKKAEQLLGAGFARCNSCYIVNLAFVDSVKGFSVIVDGKELSVSHLKKKEFMKTLADYYGGKI